MSLKFNLWTMVSSSLRLRKFINIRRIKFKSIGIRRTEETALRSRFCVFGHVNGRKGPVLAFVRTVVDICRIDNTIQLFFSAGEFPQGFPHTHSAVIFDWSACFFLGFVRPR